MYNPISVEPELREVNVPSIGEHEVLIKVRAAALNHRDLHITNPNNKKEFIYGSDGAGEIIEVGKSVKNWTKGDQVIINSQISCMECEYCLRGEHSLCDAGSVLGGVKWPGTFADYVKVPSVNAAPKPIHLSYAEAAALPLALGTAWRALITKAKLKPGESMLIQGIGGGVALYCLQIASAIGAKVFVSSGSDDKIRRAVILGALDGFNYKSAAQDPMSLSEKGYDVIVSSSAASIESSIRYAKKGGRIVQFSYLGNAIPQFDIDAVMGKQLQIIGSAMHTYSEFIEMLRYVEQSKLVPIISRRLPLDHFHEGFKEMENGNQFGKIVFEM